MESPHSLLLKPLRALGSLPSVALSSAESKSRFVLCDLSIQNDLNHMVVNNGSALLVGIDEGLRTGAVHKAWDAGRKVINQFHCVIGKNRACTSRVFHLPFNILPGLGKLIRNKEALDVDPVADRPVSLLFQLVPKLLLPGKNQGKRVFGIHFVIQKEADLLKHLPVKQMALIYNDDQLAVFHTAHDLNLVVQLFPRFSSVEMGVAAELLQ